MVDFDPVEGLFSLGFFIIMLALIFTLPDLNTFFIDFRQLDTPIIRLTQYGLMFVGFSYIMRVIL